MIVTSDIRNSIDGITSKVKEIKRVQISNEREIKLYQKVTGQIEHLDSFSKEGSRK